MTATRIIDDHLELANIGTNSHAQIDTHIAAADDYIKRDGSLALTSDWDIGDTRKIKADEIRARDGAGLKLYDDGGHGIFVKDGGKVGIGTATPSQELDLIGSLELEETTSSDTGVIYKGANRFIHNFAPPGADGNNTFVGINSGNFTMAITGSSYESSFNVGLGRNTLNNLTIGDSNLAIGSYALTSLTSGSSNLGMASFALRYNQTGIYNLAIGYKAGEGAINNSFSYNTLIGAFAGHALQANANNNVLIGYQAGNSITTGTNNIIIGYDKDTPAATTSNHLNIGGLLYGDLSGGTIGIGTATQTAKLDINSDILRLRTAKTPASAGAAGNTGDMGADANYIYRCVSTNSWKRAALNVW